MQNLKLLLGVIGGTLILVFGVAFLFSSAESGTDEATVADSALTEADRRHVKNSAEEASEDIDSELPTETEDATDSSDEEADVITIVEFSDFQCPACKASEPLVSRVVENNPGRVEVVYRHFPLEQIHPNAKAAAVASEIVGEQGFFWEYHDLLFENQEDWSAESDPTPMFISYAEEVGADVTDFESKMDDSTYIDLVEEDIKNGFALGVNSTPTIFVDGIKINNAGVLESEVTARL